MDEVVLKQILRQLKFLTFWVTLFGTIIIIAFMLGSFALYKVVVSANNSVKKLENFQQQTVKTLNVKDDLCNNTSVSSLLGSKSDVCK
ncbi:hypothetical protein H7Y63_02460 [Polaromonas sp.]|nr:hypothetical protein [Candidatus Saccharibacteria bacterium]